MCVLVSVEAEYRHQANMSLVGALTCRLASIHLRNIAVRSSRSVVVPSCWASQFVSTIHSDKYKSKPKRPLNAFVSWLQVNRESIQQNEPGASTVDIMKIAAEKWRNLPGGEKQVFFDDAQEQLKKYIEEKKLFDKSLSPGAKEEYLQALKARRKRRARLRKSKLMRNLGKPKRVRTAFMFFVKKEMSHRPSGVTVIEHMPTLAEQWKSMTTDEQKPFVEEFLEDRERYDYEIKVWKRQMAEAGYVPVTSTKGKDPL